MSGEKFIFPISDGTVQLSGGDQVWRRSSSENIHLDPTLHRQRRRTRKSLNQADLLQTHFKTHCCIMVKQEMISGPFQATLFPVNKVNKAPNCTSRRSKIPFSREVHRRDKCCKCMSGCHVGKISTGVGTLMEIAGCQIRGQVSLRSRYWMKNDRMGTHRPG